MLKAKSLAGLILITFIVFSQAKVIHDTPRNLLKKRVVRAFNRQTSSPPPPFVPKYDEQQAAYVKAHNNLRRKVGIPPLTWDANLTTAARSWAEQRKVDCDYRHHSPGKYGENLFWMQYSEFTPASVVQNWFNEQQFFDHTKNLCLCQPETDGCECGHYLNVIWKTTTRVGCSGSVYCDNQKGVYVVCSYDPAGNIKGMDPLNPGN
ncbi:pathogenesis-related protein 1C-like [Olea europaea var. sylvestris]|uniref:pathogenesis-related protein 1C-like n=1 Tax=Olea europaea var. sylvestris TaxID=158386 RepID=UPI000C1D0B7A|nr:pathogenesis-related protein 1C-like [Olea europaea var. sylvestris]